MHHNQKNCKCVSEMDTQKGRYNMFSLRQVYMTMGHNYCAMFNLFYCISNINLKLASKQVILTSIWSAQHPNTGQNIQQLRVISKKL